MKKIISVSALAVSASCHPFVGENIDSRIVHHEDNKFSARLNAQNNTNMSNFKHKSKNERGKRSVTT